MNNSRFKMSCAMGVAMMSALSAASNPTAASIYKKMLETVGKHSSVQGTGTMKIREQTLPLKFQLMWPDYYIMDTGQVELRSTGSKRYLVAPTMKQYSEEHENYELPTTLLVGFDPILKKQDKSYKPVGSATITKFNGAKVYSFTLKGPDDEMTIFVDAKTFLPAGADHVSEGDDPGGEVFFVKITYTKIDFDAQLKPADFAWSPPADYEKVSEGGRQ